MQTKILPTRAVKVLMTADKLILKALGIKLRAAKRGQVTLTMSVTKAMVNSQRICHGGPVFTLADSAGAYAAATLNVAPATSEAGISYVSAAKLGDRLTALASVEQQTSKIVYARVRVTNQAGQTVALYRGSNVSRGVVLK